MEKEFCSKLVNPLRDFRIAMEALIKPLGYQKKLNGKLNKKKYNRQTEK